MAKYILAYHPGRMPGTPQEAAALRARWSRWVESLGDAMVDPGTPLGKSFTVSAAGVSQGGGANPLMGFSVVKADGIEAALKIARDCPHLSIGTIEVAEMKRM